MRQMDDGIGIIGQPGASKTLSPMNNLKADTDKSIRQIINF
jgi:hypothetical protein